MNPTSLGVSVAADGRTKQTTGEEITYISNYYCHVYGEEEKPRGKFVGYVFLQIKISAFS